MPTGTWTVSNGCRTISCCPAPVMNVIAHAPTSGMNTSSVLWRCSAVPLPGSHWIMPRLNPCAGSAILGWRSGTSVRSTTPLPMMLIFLRRHPGRRLSTKASSLPRNAAKRATHAVISSSVVFLSFGMSMRFLLDSLLGLDFRQPRDGGPFRELGLDIGAQLLRRARHRQRAVVRQLLGQLFLPEHLDQLAVQAGHD